MVSQGRISVADAGPNTQSPPYFTSHPPAMGRVSKNDILSGCARGACCATMYHNYHLEQNPRELGSLMVYSIVERIRNGIRHPSCKCGAPNAPHSLYATPLSGVVPHPYVTNRVEVGGWHPPEIPPSPTGRGGSTRRRWGGHLGVGLRVWMTIIYYQVCFMIF